MFCAISRSFVVLMFSSTSVSSEIMALVLILPSQRILVPFMMFTPETAYQTPLYSSVEEIDKLPVLDLYPPSSPTAAGLVARLDVPPRERS